MNGFGVSEVWFFRIEGRLGGLGFVRRGNILLGERRERRGILFSVYLFLLGLGEFFWVVLVLR